jgi:hypothetical protein
MLIEVAEEATRWHCERCIQGKSRGAMRFRVSSVFLLNRNLGSNKTIRG